MAEPSQPLLDALVAGRNRLLPALGSLNSAAESTRKMNPALETIVYRPAKNRVHSKPLQDFIELVGRLSPQAQERVVGITKYAEDEWSRQPLELFAEAYALLWLTDKTLLTSTAPELAPYFMKGLHLKDDVHGHRGLRAPESGRPSPPSPRTLWIGGERNETQRSNPASRRRRLTLSGGRGALSPDPRDGRLRSSARIGFEADGSPTWWSEAPYEWG